MVFAMDLGSNLEHRLIRNRDHFEGNPETVGLTSRALSPVLGKEVDAGALLERLGLSFKANSRQELVIW